MSFHKIGPYVGINTFVCTISITDQPIVKEISVNVTKKKKSQIELHVYHKYITWNNIIISVNKVTTLLEFILQIYGCDT